MFGELLSAHRCAARLTQEELAARAGLSVDAIGLLERGARTTPRGTTVARLARALGLNEAERVAFAAAAKRKPIGAMATPSVPPDLRMQSTTFVGRGRELAQVQALLARSEVRLLTLTGSPGAGKTRLALEVSRVLAGDYRDGVMVVSLGPLSDPRLVMPAIGKAMHLHEVQGNPLDAVAAYCGARRQLLMLDNFEHLLAAGPELVELLARCPDMQAVVTSRAALRVRAEHELPVLPLELPGPAQERAGPPEALCEVASVRLFLDRAGAAVPDFCLTADNAQSVAAICRRLDGLPLALELAAPWLRLLTPEQLLERLDHRLELLVEGPRDMPERQRTMRAALTWSCDLLEPAPKALLRRLSIFAGGAPLDGVEHVCQAASALQDGILRHLAVLVDHSLVQRQGLAGGDARLTMLESVREYGRELLEAAGELEATANAHLEHYAKFAAVARGEMESQGSALGPERVTREQHNLRAALGWAAEHGRAETGLRLARALWSFWDHSGQRREELRWLERLLEVGGPVDPAVRAQGLRAAGFLAWHVGSCQLSLARYEEALAISRELGDRYGVADSLRGMGQAIARKGNHDKASSLLEESLRLFVSVRRPRDAAACLRWLAWMAWREGRTVRATRLYGAADALSPAPQDEDERRMHERTLGALHQELGGDRFSAAYEASSRLSLADAAEVPAQAVHS